MKRTLDTSASSLGREIAVRIPTTMAAVLNHHMRQDARNEQMAFALGRKAKTADGTTYIVSELLLPDREDLSEQSVAGVCPTRQFQSTVYFLAAQKRASIVEFHTHPGGGVPHFSGIDDAHAYPNGEYIRKHLPDPTSLVMIVGNNRFDAFDGVAYDRHNGQFRQLDRFEVLGRPSRLNYIGEPASVATTSSENFDRQQRIPGWNQLGLERQRIGIIGMGGNGAPLFQSLLSLGAGKQGFIAVADHDLIEASNLPRIPYAFAEQVGVPKVNSALQYAARKSPATPIYAFPCQFNESAVKSRMKSATVLFYCGDNDGGRKETNEFAVRYGIPLIDLGCDIQVDEGSVTAGGQVRLVLPGENACLVCCGGFDAAQAAIDQMDDEARARHAAVGYVHGAEATATPSVANLNAMTAQHALAQFLALVCGGNFARWDYLHFDQFTGQTIPARTERVEDCPVCGPEGVFVAGDPLPVVKKQGTGQALRRVELKA